MLTVETIGRIRREYFLKGKAIKEIARDLRVSRNTVRKVVRSGETSFAYDRDVQPRPKLGRWTAELDELLAGNVATVAREQRTLIRIFEDLRGRGYAGGYDAVRRYARRWSEARGHSTAAAYVPLTFAPGEAYQFDWSHEVVLLRGVTVIVKAAHVRLCHSRMLFVRVYPRETQEMVFDAHDRAFALFKGACRRGIYDNMKTAVETILVDPHRLYNRRFLQMCSHEPALACVDVAEPVLLVLGRKAREVVCEDGNHPHTALVPSQAKGLQEHLVAVVGGLSVVVSIGDRNEARVVVEVEQVAWIGVVAFEDVKLEEDGLYLRCPEAESAGERPFALVVYGDGRLKVRWTRVQADGLRLVLEEAKLLINSRRPKALDVRVHVPHHHDQAVSDEGADGHEGIGVESEYRGKGTQWSAVELTRAQVEVRHGSDDQLLVRRERPHAQLPPRPLLRYRGSRPGQRPMRHPAVLEIASR